jgi:hypothetical protein
MQKSSYIEFYGYNLLVFLQMSIKKLLSCLIMNGRCIIAITILLLKDDDRDTRR